MVQLKDTDPMPFGQYSKTTPVTPMQDVPARYLHYLWGVGLKEDKVSPVADYIRRNMCALEKELPDAIW